jgi:hypothetical protein
MGQSSRCACRPVHPAKACGMEKSTQERSGKKRRRPAPLEMTWGAGRSRYGTSDVLLAPSNENGVKIAACRTGESGLA